MICSVWLVSQQQQPWSRPTNNSEIQIRGSNLNDVVVNLATDGWMTEVNYVTLISKTDSQLVSQVQI